MTVKKTYWHVGGVVTFDEDGKVIALADGVDEVPTSFEGMQMAIAEADADLKRRSQDADHE